MKKFFLFSSGLIAFLLILSLSSTESKADSTQDIYCPYGGNDSFYATLDTTENYYQKFYPTKNRLTIVRVHLGGFSASPSTATVTLKVQTSTGTEVLSPQQKYIETSGSTPHYDYTFDGFDVAVTPGNMYKLILQETAGNAFWYKSTECTVNGNAHEGVMDLTAVDYVFTTYGYDASPTPTPAPTSTPTPAPGTSSAPSTSSTPASTPSTATTTSIAKPTNATAQYVADGNKVKVSWTKSTTTDIDGYRIYRSEKKTTGFTKVGQTTKVIYEYSDTGLAADKTYYYFVRAYKGTGESASSNTAEVKTPAALIATPVATGSAATKSAKLSTPTATVKAESTTNWWFYGSLAVLVLLLIAFLAAYELKLKKMWAKGRESKGQTENK